MKVWLGHATRWWHPLELLQPIKWAFRISDDEYYGVQDEITLIGRFGKTWLGRWLTRMSYKSHMRRYIRIDPWDTWDPQYDLALIIAPVLRKLKEDKHGIPFTEAIDAPTEAEDGFNEERWDWILDEMIFAFTAITDPNRENQFYTGKPSFHYEKIELNGIELSEVKFDANDTFRVDHGGQKVYEDRISNGLRLFGKYYQALWS